MERKFIIEKWERGNRFFFCTEIPRLPKCSSSFCRSIRQTATFFLMDFLGNGRADRVEEFPPALWIEWGRQAAALVRHLDMGKVSLVGTSGGAWSAVNAALECPELVEKVV